MSNRAPIPRQWAADVIYRAKLIANGVSAKMIPADADSHTLNCIGNICGIYLDDESMETQNPSRWRIEQTRSQWLAGNLPAKQRPKILSHYNICTVFAWTTGIGMSIWFVIALWTVFTSP